MSHHAKTGEKSHVPRRQHAKMGMRRLQEEVARPQSLVWESFSATPGAFDEAGNDTAYSHFFKVSAVLLSGTSKVSRHAGTMLHCERMDSC